MHSCPVLWLANFFAAVGAINWGLVAFIQFNAVEYLCNLVKVPYLNMVVYGIVAVCGVYSLIFLLMKTTCGVCK